MQNARHTPWSGILVAALTSVAITTTGVNIWLVVALLLVWIGSLFLVAPAPAQPDRRPVQPSFSEASIGELIEHSATPQLMTDRNRVLIANEAARKVLGNHIVDQDVRVAFRHPEAIALLQMEKAGTATIHGLARRKDIWQMNRQMMDERFAIIELINQTAEAVVSRAHTDFVANASHELRTPLSSIIGYVETLMDDADALPAETQKRFLGTILSEATRLQSLVSDLMSLSRVEAEKHDEPDQQVALKHLIETSARDAAGVERIDRIQFDCPEEVTIQGDERQLEQLVRNLVDNALKYGAREKPVTISLETPEINRVRIMVKDCGDGIAPEHLPHLTRRFYRTDPGRSRASGGTGLGLAIVKHIVERHRGALDITSKIGDGTTVEVRLPIKR